MDDHFCIFCPTFITSNHSEMKRHVAVVHSNGHFSTWYCDICQRKFYDLADFGDHIKAKPGCFKGAYTVSQVPLDDQEQKAFLSLVEQMMKPIATLRPSIQNSATPSISSSETSSIDQPDMPPSLKIISVTSLSTCRHLFDKIPSSPEDINAMYLNGPAKYEKEVLPDDQIEWSEESESGIERAIEVEQNRSDIEMQQSFDGHLAIVKEEIEKSQKIVINVSKNIRSPPNIRNLHQYCKRVIRQRCIEERITCKFCHTSLKVVFSKRISDIPPLRHVRSHLKLATYHCKLCDHADFSTKSIRKHLINVHNGQGDEFTDTSMEHVEKLIDLFAKCFDHAISVENAKSGRRGWRPLDSIDHELLENEIDDIGDHDPWEGDQERGELIDQEMTHQSTEDQTITEYDVDQEDSMAKSIDQVIDQNMVVKSIDQMITGESDDWQKTEGSAKSAVSKPSDWGLEDSNSDNDANNLTATSPSTDGVIGSKKPYAKKPKCIQMENRQCWDEVIRFVEDGKLRCRLCPHCVTVASSPKEGSPKLESYRAFRHAITHLEQCVYFCSQCPFSGRSWTTVWHHVKKRHNRNGKVIDQSTDHHEDILKVFMNCYDWS